MSTGSCSVFRIVKVGTVSALKATSSRVCPSTTGHTTILTCPLVLCPCWTAKATGAGFPVEASVRILTSGTRNASSIVGRAVESWIAGLAVMGVLIVASLANDFGTFDSSIAMTM